MELGLVWKDQRRRRGWLSDDTLPALEHVGERDLVV